MNGKGEGGRCTAGPQTALDSLTTERSVGIISNMRARLLVDQRIILSGHEFAEIIVWEVPAPLRGSGHDLKYRLAFVVNGECVMRYDNEAGNGDHRHAGGQERAYRFESIEKLLADFERDIARWRDENHNA